MPTGGIVSDDSVASGALGAEGPIVGPPRRLPRSGRRGVSTDDGDSAPEGCSNTRMAAARDTCGNAARTNAACVPMKASIARKSRARRPRLERRSRRTRITASESESLP